MAVADGLVAARKEVIPGGTLARPAQRAGPLAIGPGVRTVPISWGVSGSFSTTSVPFSPADADCARSVWSAIDCLRCVGGGRRLAQRARGACRPSADRRLRRPDVGFGRIAVNTATFPDGFSPLDRHLSRGAGWASLGVLERQHPSGECLVCEDKETGRPIGSTRWTTPVALWCRDEEQRLRTDRYMH